MFLEIRKRNGSTAPFEASKITNAIGKAGKATGEYDEKVARMLTVKVISLAEVFYGALNTPTVEGIQDIVEQVLLDSPYRKTAKAYIIYREQHARLREIRSQMDIDKMKDYLLKADWNVKENANMDYSLQGLNNYISSETSKTFLLNEIYTPEIRNAHVNGDFHIHDLGIVAAYCVGWDLYQLLCEGFTGVPGKVEAGPAKHLRSAMGQAVNFFYTMQGESAGAQAFSNFDTLLAPFIRFDGLDYKRTKQAIQEFVFNVNVPTRVGFQTPFTNITLDIKAPTYLAQKSVLIGGQPQNSTYGEYQAEMDMFNRAFLEVMAAGDYKGRCFTFPIPTYNVTKCFDWENPVLEDLWQATAKFGTPYFANFVNSDMSPEDARSMCCRLRIDNRELVKRGGGLFGSNPLTGSIGVITINMPRLGLLSEKSEVNFIERVDHLMVLAKDSLETKRKILEQYTDRGLYPYTRHYLRDVKARLGGYWKNHFSTVGLVGMNEACLNLLGKDMGDEAAQCFTRKVLDYMRLRLLDFQTETGNNYNLEATPAEGCSYRLARIDRKTYSGMRFANGNGNGAPEDVYYTNSTQLPVNYTDDLFEALDLQDSIQTKYTGGTVFHAYLGERVHNPSGVKALVKKVCEQYKLPYFTLTPTFSICPNHGYINGEQKTCPQCQSDCEVYSRITGYLRPVQQWHRGKQLEFNDRVKYTV